MPRKPKAKIEEGPFGVHKIELLPINEIKPWPNNPRKNEMAVEPIANSIKQYGMLVPILINKKNEVIAGNTRLKACLHLGMKKVPCVRGEHLTKEQQTAFNIADNKLSEIAAWDEDMLREIMTGLQESMEGSYDFTQIGFQAAESDLILGGWNSNAQRMTDIGSDDSAAMARIVIKCKQEDEDAIRIVIDEAIKKSEHQGVILS